jgi:hypothetical protein
MRLALLVLTLLLAGCATSDDSGSPAADGDLSVAEKAAVIDGGGDPSEYQTAFDQLRKDCADHPSEERIADMLVVARDKLAEAGIQESLLSIAKNAGKASAEAGKANQDCATLLGSYVFLRRGG